MTRFRSHVAGLVLVVATLAAIERLSPAGGAGAVALLAVLGVAIGAIVMIPRVSRAPLVGIVALAALAYVALRANPFVAERDWAGWAPALALLELTLCVMAVVSARHVALQLIEFEDAVANITFGDLVGVKSLESAAESISVEMSRARRHERPLTVTVLSADASSTPWTLHRIVQDVQHAMLQRYIMSGLTRIASQITRRGDIVVRDVARNRVIVLSPEATPEQVEHLAGRLQFVAADRLGLPVRYGSAGFPQHALTFDDLVARAAMMAGDNVEGEHAPTNEIAMRRRRHTWAAAGETRIIVPMNDAGVQEADATLIDAVRGD